MIRSRSTAASAGIGPAVLARTARAAAIGLIGGLLACAPTRSFADCSVSAQGVEFGTYDPTANADLDGAGYIDTRCDQATPFSVALDTGSGSFDARTLRAGANVLHYNLFTNVARSTVWGDGSGATAVVAGNGVGGSLTVYGRIPARQNGHVGNYVDAVVVTVTF